MSEEFPRPSKLLIIASVLVIGVTLCVLSMVVGNLIAAKNPMAFMMAVIITPLFAAIALLQYRGTFRASASAASAMSLLLYFASGLVTFAGVLGIAEELWQGARFGIREWGILAGLFALAGTLIAVGRLNYTWSRHAWLALAAEVVPGRRGISLREFFGLTAAVALVAGVTSWATRDDGPRMKEHVSASTAPIELPVGATDVSYAYIPGGSLACEFSTSEEALRTWVDTGFGNFAQETADTQLGEITDPISITWYGRLIETWRSEVWINDGIYYGLSKEHHGPQAAYNRETGRGYYYSESR